jgi:hypothetical protein
VEYKMPETLTLTSEQVRDIWQTGKLTTQEQQSLFGSLELNSYDTRAAIEHGINISIPAEKIVRLTDKPYWSKVKSWFGQETKTEVSTTQAGKPTKEVSGLIEGKTTGEGKVGAIAKQYGYDIKYIDKKPKDYYAKHFSDKKIIEVYTKGRTPEQIQDALLHEEGHIVDYTRRGIIADPMGDSIMGFDKKLRPAMDSDIYFRNEPFKTEAENIRKELPKTHSLATTQKEIWADAYKLYKQSPEKLKEVAPNIYKTMEDFSTPTGGKVETPILTTQPTGDAVQNVITALKEAKSVRGEQETLYAKARSQKFAKMQAIGQKTSGEKGFYAQLGALKGEMPKVEFEAIRGKISQEDIDSLFNMVKESPKIGPWEKLGASQGLAKMFGELGGKVPTKGEIALLHEVFGKEFTQAILDKQYLVHSWQVLIYLLLCDKGYFL